MDVDPPQQLKRSSSAPLINELGAGNSGPGRSMDSPPLFPSTVSRCRRFSASFSPSGEHPPCYAPSRILQLKHEEGMDMLGREVAHESNMHNALRISQSWEDLTLALDQSNRQSPSSLPPSSPSTHSPLHLNLPPNSPLSPKRHLFSPSMPSPSPSPTRRCFTTRRSQSPIMRPSPLGPVKRKHDGLLECVDTPTAKRHNVTQHTSISSSCTSDSMSSIDSPDSEMSVSPRLLFKAKRHLVPMEVTQQASSQGSTDMQ